MCGLAVVHTFNDRAISTADSYAKKPTTAQSDDVSAGDTRLTLIGNPPVSEKDPLDIREISEPGKHKPYVPNQQEITTEDVINLQPSATPRTKDQKSPRGDKVGQLGSLGSPFGSHISDSTIYQ